MKKDIQRRSFIKIASGAGMAGSGTAAVTGVVNLVFITIRTETITENDVWIIGHTVNILSEDDYYVLGIVGAFAASGVAGVGITALVAIVFSTVTTDIGTNNRITSTAGDVAVEAASKRRFDSFCLTFGGGQVGVSVAVSVLIIGDSLIDDIEEVFFPDGSNSCP